MGNGMRIPKIIPALALLASGLSSLAPAQQPVEEKPKPPEQEEKAPEYDFLNILMSNSPSTIDLTVLNGPWQPSELHYKCLLINSNGKEATINMEIPELEGSTTGLNTSHKRERWLAQYAETHDEAKQPRCAEVFRNASLRLQLGNIVSPVEDGYRGEQIMLLQDILDSTEDRLSRKRDALETGLEQVANLEGFEGVQNDLATQLERTNYWLTEIKQTDPTTTRPETTTLETIKQVMRSGFHDSKETEDGIAVVDYTGLLREWYAVELDAIDTRARLVSNVNYGDYPVAAHSWTLVANALAKTRDKAYEISSPKTFPDWEEFEPSEAAYEVDNMVDTDLRRLYTNTQAQLEYVSAIPTDLWHETADIAKHLVRHLEEVDYESLSQEEQMEVATAALTIHEVYIDSNAHLSALDAPSGFSPCREVNPLTVVGNLETIAGELGIQSKVLPEARELIEKRVAAQPYETEFPCVPFRPMQAIDESLLK